MNKLYKKYYLITLISILVVCIYILLINVNVLMNRSDSSTLEASVIKSLEDKSLFDHCEEGNGDACWIIVEEAKANGIHEKALDYSIKSCLNNNISGCDFITNEALENNKNLFKENKPALAAITIACTDTTFTVSTESCEKLGNWYFLENNPHFAKKVFARLHFPEFRKSLSIVKLGLIYQEEGYDDLPCILYYIACDLGLNEGCKKLNLCKIDNGFVRVKVTENKNHDNEKKSKLEKSKHIFDIISQSKNKTSLNEDELLNKIYQIEQISKASSFFLFLTSLSKFENTYGNKDKAIKISSELCEVYNNMGLFNWPCIEYVKLKGIDRILEDHESHLNYLCENHDISSCRSLGFYYDSAKRHDDSAQIYKKLCNPTRPSNIDCWEYYKSAIKADQINEAILMAEKLCKTYYSQECLDFAEFLKASGHEKKADYYFKLGCWEGLEKACDHSGSITRNFMWKQKRFNEFEQLCQSGKPRSCLRLLHGIKKNNGNINNTIALTRAVASKNCSLGIKEDCAIELFMDCFTDKKESTVKKLAASCSEGSFNACNFEKHCLNPW